MRTRYRSESTVMLIGIIFALLGLAVIATLIHQIRQWNDFKKYAEPVTAQITDIETHRSRSNGKTRTVHKVYISYTYDGKQYDRKLDFYDAGMKEGDSVGILVDPNDPSKLMSSPTGSIAVSMIFGMIFFGIGAGVLGNELRKAIIINRLIDRDLYVVCNDWTEQMSGVRVNRVRYRCIRAFYDDGYHRYEFVSHAYHPNKCPLMPGESVAVYVDIENPKTYYVALER